MTGRAAAALVSVSLAGCAVPAAYDPGFQVMDAYPAGRGLTAVLRRHLPDGAVSLDFPGAGGHVPLPAFADARIVQVSPFGQEVVSLIRGSNASCPVSYVMVANSGGNLKWTKAFGDCNSDFDVIAARDGIAAVQQGGPLAVLYTGGRFLTGNRNGGASTPRGRSQPPASRAAPPYRIPPVAATPAPVPAPFQSEAAPVAAAPRKRLGRVGPEVVPDAASLPARPKAPIPSFDPS